MEQRIKQLEEQLDKAQKAIVKHYITLRAAEVAIVKSGDPQLLKDFNEEQERLRKESDSFMLNPGTKSNYFPG
jgi:precorrin-4 methylase